MATATITEKKCSNPQVLRDRARQLLETELEFIDNPEFRSIADIEPISCEADPIKDGQMSLGAKPASDLPAHLARLCAADLLTPEEERALFRRMNFLKFRANALRWRLDLDDPDADRILEIENMIEQSQAVRDQIIRANMRLVISIVKKFVSPSFSFDELLSDGIVILMNAVEKFDYDRGFRFSTYAYRSIARNAYRKVTDRKKEHSRYAAVAEETLAGSLEDGSTASMSERTWERLRGMLTRFMKNLDDRERQIVRARYALGQYRTVQTFQSIADKLGVSKERVRQLEQRAVGKLQKMAEENVAEAVA